MSFKYQVIKDTDNRFVLPQVGDMNCKVVAFLNDELNDGTDEKLWQQAAQSASYPGVTHVFLMPDTHLGYGVPIGGVVPGRGGSVQRIRDAVRALVHPGGRGVLRPEPHREGHLQGGSADGVTRGWEPLHRDAG